jgi:hypothetical protein
MGDEATTVHLPKVRRATVRLAAAALLLAAASAGADTQAPNTAYRVSDPEGQCYAESIPHRERGQVGRTYVHRDGGDEDPLYTFDWYATGLEIHCGVVGPDGRPGIALVRYGPSPKGGRARRSDLALAFFFDGRPTREYSTLDIAGTSDAVSRTVSHYTVIESTQIDRSAGRLIVTTVDGRTLAFDLATGERLAGSPG